MIRVVLLPTEADTRALGARLGALCAPGTAVGLSGPLGAGKTVFARGFGEGVGVVGRLTSPTFVLVAIHEGGRLPVWHADLYRLAEGADDAEIDDLGLDAAIAGALLVEWPDRAPGALPSDRLDVALEIDGEGRVATLRARGPRHAALLARLLEDDR
jgi:tRNA threonylcarbamoyladenosine biosynthesis protein TsaE